MVVVVVFRLSRVSSGGSGLTTDCCCCCCGSEMEKETTGIDWDVLSVRCSGDAAVGGAETVVLVMVFAFTDLMPEEEVAAAPLTFDAEGGPPSWPHEL